MGSKSATSNLDSSNTNADNRIIEGNNAIMGGNVTLSNAGDGSGVFNVTTTDFGALDVASELAERSITSIDNSVAAVQEIAGDTGARLNSALNKVTDFATTQSGATSSETIKYLIIAVAVVGAAFAFKK